MREKVDIIPLDSSPSITQLSFGSVKWEEDVSGICVFKMNTICFLLWFSFLSFFLVFSECVCVDTLYKKTC